jgi:hypothetical protein
MPFGAASWKNITAWLLSWRGAALIRSRCRSSFCLPYIGFALSPQSAARSNCPIRHQRAQRDDARHDDKREPRLRRAPADSARSSRCRCPASRPSPADHAARPCTSAPADGQARAALAQVARSPVRRWPARRRLAWILRGAINLSLAMRKPAATMRAPERPGPALE